ncbi:hypothetical protein K2X05_13995, partial [bacterium]|nr:hypothetical protein [bacterium]
MSLEISSSFCIFLLIIMRNLCRMAFLNFDQSLQAALLKKTSRITSSDHLLSTAFLLSHSVVAQKSPQHLVITKDLSSATKLLKYIELFSGFLGSTSLKTYILPPHDISPYSGLYSSRAAMLQRLRWYFQASLPTPNTILIAPLKSLGQSTLPQELFLNSIHFFKKMDVLPENLPVFLLSLGYQNVPIVDDPGTFSMRGGLVDIF